MSTVGTIKTVLSQDSGPAANAIVLRIGLLEPRAAIRARLMVVNANKPRAPTLNAVSSLRGLPPPLLTTQSPDERIASKLVLWLWPAFAALLIFEMIRDYRRQRQEAESQKIQTHLSQAIEFAWRFLLLLLLSAMAAFFVGKLIGWVVATTIDFGLFA